MKNLKKSLLVSVSLVLVAALAVGLTLAYLQDTDSDVNVMTMGNVSIEQQEWQRADGVSHVNPGAKEGDLVPFKQGQALLPAVPQNGLATDYSAEKTNLFVWGDYAPGSNGLWDDSKLANVMDKIVMVKNTGKTDAFYRTVFAIECPEGILIGEPAKGAEIMLNTNGNYRFDWEMNGHIMIDNVRYSLWVANYNEILKPGEVSRPSLLQLVLTHNATNEDVAKFGDTLDVLVVSQAVQAAGFKDAATALDTAFGDISVENHPWIKEYPVHVSSDAELDAAIAKGAKQVILGAGTYTVPDRSNVTLIGESKDAIIDCTGNAGSHSSYIKFINVTIQGVNKDYTGIQHSGTVLYEDCLIKDSLTLYAKTVEFSNCEFNLTGRYIWTYDADNVLFENCVFNNADSRSILVYDDYKNPSDEVNYITVRNCSFNADAKGYTSSQDWTAAIEIDASAVAASVVAENNSVDGNYNGVVRIKKGEPTVSENGSKKIDLAISSAEELVSFANDVNVNHNNYAGKTVALTSNIDLSGIDWTPIGQTGHTQFNGTFDGQGYIISNMTVNNTDESKNCSSGLFGWLNGSAVKNVVLDNADVSGYHLVGGIAGYVESATVENCKVMNSAFSCVMKNSDADGDKSGAVVGQIGATQGKVINCSAENCTVSAGRDAGQVVGAALTNLANNVIGCSATNVTVTSNGTSTGANIRNEVIGRV